MLQFILISSFDSYHIYIVYLFLSCSNYIIVTVIALEVVVEVEVDVEGGVEVQQTLMK